MTLAVLVCGWAHVLHAMYKPWGAGSGMYALQHGSLFVTSFVFLMVRRNARTFTRSSFGHRLCSALCVVS